jgi:hypothetical protein
MSESKTKVTHIDIAKSEVVKERFEANTSRMKEILNESVMSLTRKQDPVRQIPKRGSKFIFECESCTASFVEPPTLPSEECTECGSQVHIIEMPSDLWDEKYEVVYR